MALPPVPRGTVRCPNCKKLYRSNLPRCPTCGTPNPMGTPAAAPPTPRPATPSPSPLGVGKLKKDYVRCRVCFAQYHKASYECPVCGEPNPIVAARYAAKPGRTLCKACNRPYAAKEKKCPYCHTPNPGYVKPTALKVSIGKRVSAKYYEMIAFIIAGIVVWYVLGWNFLPLTFALSALIPFHILLPSERSILKSIPEGEEVSALLMTPLIIKTFIKLAIVGLITYNFMLLRPVIGLIIIFFYYFTLPVSYKTIKPHKLVEAWLRPIMGVILALLLYSTFAGVPASGPFLLLGIAFFATVPIQKELDPDEEGKSTVTVKISGKLGKLSSAWEILDKFIFVLFTLFAGGIYILTNLPITGAPHQLIFLGIWVVSSIGGYLTGPQGRPFIGILTITVTIFMFSFAYGGVVGRAIFGYWWPQVEAFGETVITPMTEGIGMATSSLGDVWLLLTNPAEYYRRQMELTQVRTTRVMEGGTYKSIELSAFDINPSTPGILEPTEPLLGVIDLENQGEFDANYIKLGVDATWRPIETQLDEPSKQAGRLSKITCSGQGEPNINICTWDRITHPGDIKEVTFIFDKDEWDSELKECENEDGDCISCSASDCPGATYTNANTNVKINAQVNYTYNVNVSMPVEVIDQSLYEKLLIAREIRLEQFESVYSGGPVKATIWTQKQPLRNGEESLVKVFIYNEAGGSLDFVNYTIYVHPNLALGTLELATSNLNGCDEGDDFSKLSSTHPTFPDYQYKVCTHDEPIEKGKYKLVSFYINSTIGANIDRRTFSIIGLVNYNYSKTRTQILTLANNPPGATGD